MGRQPDEVRPAGRRYGQRSHGYRRSGSCFQGQCGTPARSWRTLPRRHAPETGQQSPIPSYQPGPPSARGDAASRRPGTEATPSWQDTEGWRPEDREPVPSDRGSYGRSQPPEPQSQQPSGSHSEGRSVNELLAALGGNDGPPRRRRRRDD